MFKHFFISHNILCVAVQPKVSNSSIQKPSLSELIHSTTFALLSLLRVIFLSFCESANEKIKLLISLRLTFYCNFRRCLFNFNLLYAIRALIVNAQGTQTNVKCQTCGEQLSKLFVTGSLPQALSLALTHSLSLSVFLSVVYYKYVSLICFRLTYFIVAISRNSSKQKKKKRKKLTH